MEQGAAACRLEVCPRPPQQPGTGDVPSPPLWHLLSWSLVGQRLSTGVRGGAPSSQKGRLGWTATQQLRGRAPDTSHGVALGSPSASTEASGGGLTCSHLLTLGAPYPSGLLWPLVMDTHWEVP